ncbi:MAG: hypothetical protein KC731_19730, partial [Myxococcales bacterium]|nr:hypothetical protein [Myxococcales bacterium]
LGQLLAALPRETPPDPDALTPLLRVAQGDPPNLARRRDAATQLWRDVADSDGPAAAWAALLTALLADPDLAIY